MATYTREPEKTPAAHLSTIICHRLLLNPNKDAVASNPVKDVIITGFLPNASAARPHGIIMII
jgi:hypothetical protein